MILHIVVRLKNSFKEMKGTVKGSFQALDLAIEIAEEIYDYAELKRQAQEAKKNFIETWMR